MCVVVFVLNAHDTILGVLLALHTGTPHWPTPCLQRKKVGGRRTDACGEIASTESQFEENAAVHEFFAARLASNITLLDTLVVSSQIVLIDDGSSCARVHTDTACSMHPFRAPCKAG